MTIDISDFRVHEDSAVDLREWPTQVKAVCKSKKAYKKLLEENVEQHAICSGFTPRPTGMRCC